MNPRLSMASEAEMARYRVRRRWYLVDRGCAVISLAAASSLIGAAWFGVASWWAAAPISVFLIVLAGLWSEGRKPVRPAEPEKIEPRVSRAPSGPTRTDPEIPGAERDWVGGQPATGVQQQPEPRFVYGVVDGEVVRTGAMELGLIVSNHGLPKPAATVDIIVANACLDGLVAGGMTMDEAARRVGPLVREIKLQMPIEAPHLAAKLESAETLLASWQAEIHRMRAERDALTKLTMLTIPHEVSRETLDAVREAFQAPGDLRVLEVIDVTGDEARALALRVTPRLLALPIPTEAREILEDLARLGGVEEAP